MHRLSRTWLVKVTLLVTIGRGLVATAEGAVKTGAFTDDACAFTKSRCAVSNKKRGGCFSGCRLHLHEITLRSVQKKRRGVLFWMSLAPPRNHVAQCPKNRTTSLILPMTLAPSLSHVAQCPTKRGGCFSGCRLHLHEITLRSVHKITAHY